MPRIQLPAAFIGSLVVVLAVLGCDRLQNAGTPVSFVTEYSPISFTFPSGWKLNPKEHPFDLQATSKFQDQNTAIFVFKAEDIGEDSSPMETFEFQIDDLRSKRKNFEEMEPLKETTIEGKRISEITYVGEKDASRNCYRFALVEFLSDTNRFAIAIQIVRPGAWKKTKPIFEEIVRSATPLADSQ